MKSRHVYIAISIIAIIEIGTILFLNYYKFKNIRADNIEHIVEEADYYNEISDTFLTISGIAVNLSTNGCLPGILVEANNDLYSSTCKTNENGEFNLFVVPGIYNIVFNTESGKIHQYNDLMVDGDISLGTVELSLRGPNYNELYRNGLQIYRDVLDMYYANIIGGWNDCDGMDSDNALDPDSVNIMVYYNEDNNLTNLGYAFIDLDENGTPELLIGNTDNESLIYNLYTAIEDNLVLLASGGRRFGYFLAENNTVNFRSSSGTMEYINYSVVENRNTLVGNTLYIYQRWDVDDLKEGEYIGNVTEWEESNHDTRILKRIEDDSTINRNYPSDKEYDVTTFDKYPFKENTINEISPFRLLSVDLIGRWKIDTNYLPLDIKNDVNSGYSFRNEMTFGPNNTFSYYYYLGKGYGGEGNYVRIKNDISCAIDRYEDGETELPGLSIRIDDFGEIYIDMPTKYGSLHWKKFST